MAKRRFISFLPEWNQTDDLTSFFGTTVDEVFQPGVSEPLSGYIGRKPATLGIQYTTIGDVPAGSTNLTVISTAAIQVGQAVSGTNIDTNTFIVAETDTVLALNKPLLGPVPDGTTILIDNATDFYVNEPTASRAAYQLETGMISLDTTGAINNAMTYPDFISYLTSEGANVTNHQRLFETEYYSWAPPINLDALVNYNQYYWFGDDTGQTDLPILVLTIPFLAYTGDGTTTTYALPPSINAVSIGEETPTVYVNGVSVAFTLSSNSVILHVAPTSGSGILVARVLNFVSTTTGMTTVDVSDINTEGVTDLSSGMRVHVVDMFGITGDWDELPLDETLWDAGGTQVYMVDGVGLGVRYTADDELLYDVEAQYVTIDRSSAQSNLWSLHNLWVHKDTFAWSGAQFPARKAVRPIIEFIRDIVLYPGQVWSESTDPLFMLYDLEGRALNDPGFYPSSNFFGNRIFGYATGSAPPDPILLRSLSFDANDYIVFQVDAAAIPYSFISASVIEPITGLASYQLNDGVDAPTNEPLWHLGPETTVQNQTNAVGFFDVPINLQANPTSQDVTIISQSTWMGQFGSIIDNQTGIIGNALGDNNYRDTPRNLTLGNAILQHRAPLLKVMLLASNTLLDLPQAIQYADQEYTKFRAKFVRKLVDMNNLGTLQGVDPTVNPTQWVLTALSELNRDKNPTFPFALNTIGGAQYFIPPTPAALGVLPAAVPTMLTDTTYASPILMIQGHDGSLTPAFNDWRDNVLLQLETLIYTNLPSELQTEARPVFDIQLWIGTRFYAPFNGYTREELVAILTPSFELWAQQNHIDYRTNSTYDSGNPFTWNYSGVPDRFGNTLPGNWRAIYRWYYGTDSPHTRPWEMLGFVSQPSWWVTNYGAAPYTRSNTHMWTDIANGTIAGGPRAGTDLNYERVGLANLIPVDNNGVLLNPLQAGIVNVNVTFDVGSAPWQVGDGGPAENLWIISPAYRYALATGAFLMKPARFVEECWDVLNIGYVGDQWVELPTSPRPPFSRPQNSEQYVFGEVAPNGIVSTVTGISQWISDFLVSSGQNITNVFGGSVRTLDARLIHQMAGFVSLDDVQALADNFGLVPTENINAVLYTSAVISSEVYSGAILEWTGRSWRIIGYDARTPFFTIIPGDPNGPKGVISLATSVEPTIVEWRPNTFYPINILAIYLNAVYQCARSHTSGPRFEADFWKLRPDLSGSMIQAPRVVTYAIGLNTTQQIAYGTEFTDYQSVADALLGYERWLVSRGWIFDTLDPGSGLLRNWSLAVREFLTWAQVQWAPGNFIALSPGMQGLEFNTDFGTILNVESSFTGFFGLLDRAGQPISNRNAIINRLDGDITMSARDADIFCARLNIVEIEHALVFDNVTIFDDNIYLPLFDLRQPRLRLICNRSTDWAGRLDAPGFVIIGNLLRSDFDKAADDVRLMFDIELADQPTLRNYARHVVGFQTRDYLENLLVSDVEQFEFYQGMISQKGSPGVFQKLMRSNRASDNSDLLFLEEWAIRLGEYGAPIDPFFTFLLLQSDMRDDPQLIRFAPTNAAPRDWLIIAQPRDPHWVDLPSSMAFFPLLPEYPTPAVPTAGPVRLSDVLYTVFSIIDIPGLYFQSFAAGTTPFPAGSSTWVYERADHTYTVLRSFETGYMPNAILTVTSVAEDPTVTTSRIYFQQTMYITPADVGNYLVVDGLSQTNPDLQGVQVILDVNVAGNYVDLETVLTVGFDFTSMPASAPFVRILREVRFPTRAALVAANLPFGYGDLAWIDADTNGLWAVVVWRRGGFLTVRSQPPRTDSRPISETVVYEMGTTISGQQMFIDEPVIDDVIVIDPLVGLIAGIADREIDFKTTFDPAQYNAGATVLSSNPWGANQVGRVWWNLATVKFLDPFTDVIGASDARDATELAYRVANWSRIAPNTSVDIYQWVLSTVDPNTYMNLTMSDTTGTFVGTVYNPDNPSWVQNVIVDPASGQLVTQYYFWVAGLTVTPSVPFRHMDISSVALAIENPSGLNLSWMAPIHSDCIIVSGVLPFLDDVATVLKVRLTFDSDNMGRHNEWLLMRPGDDTSLPPDLLWQQLRDSLGGFNDYLQVLPNPALTPARSVGIYRGQNMFVVPNADGEHGGLLAARASFVGIINNILAANPVAIQRLSFVPTLFRSTPINPNLIWSLPDTSYVFEPPPRNEWDIQVYTITERNRLVATPEFEAGNQVRVLLNGIGEPTPRWSIWVYNATGVGWDDAAWDGGWDSKPVEVDNGFTLATSYDRMVDTTAERDALVTTGILIAVGTRVLVNNDALGFWAIWKWTGTPASGNPVDGFVLWRIQSYRTDDFVAYVDWYASGYAATSPPIVSYPTMQARNATEGPSPNNLFVKVNDNGHGIWIWTVWNAVSLQWDTVAYQNGTLALGDGSNTSNNFLDPTRQDLWSLLFGWDDPEWDSDGWDVAVATLPTALIDQIADRDGSWELRVLAQALRYGGMLLDSEINEMFFSLLNFVHAQQNQVDWAFKTSFMSLLGYNVPLQQTPVLVQDTTPSLISYIDEVKPYHVKLRQYSTQYNPDIDAASVHATDFDKPVYLDPVTNTYRVLDPNNANDLAILQFSEPWKDWYAVQNEALVRSFDMTLLFDRITDTLAMGWGETPWDTLGWDNTETAKNFAYVHTTVNATLSSPSATIGVNDVRFILAQWSDDIPTPITPSNPLQVTINTHSYFVGAVAKDATNISTTRGYSGTLTTVSGNFSVPDGTSGNLVEFTLPQPSASRRIFDYYAPTSEMPPNDLTLLLDLDVHGLTISYLTEAAVANGGVVLTFVSTLGVVLNAPVAGPAIIKGTLVSDVSSTTVTLNAPVISAIPAGATITFGLPNAIDGYILNAYSAPGSFDIGGFDNVDFDENTGILDVTYDGGTDPLDPSTIEVDINPPLPSRPGGLDLRDPYYAADHPQERLPFTSDDGLQMTVTALPLAGGPSQIIKEFFVGAMTTSTTTLFYDLVAHASDAVLVFRDGVRATLNADYTVDHFHRTVTVNLLIGMDRVTKVLIHVFGFGGTSTIDDRYYYSFASNPLPIDQTSSTADARVVVGGVALTGGEYTVSGTNVTLTSPPSAGSDVAIVLYHGGTSTATEIQFQTLTYNAMQTWTLNPVDTQTFPQHAGTFVEVNGLRLTPPLTFYGFFTPAQPYTLLPVMPNINTDTITIYVNGVIYDNPNLVPLPLCTTTDPSSNYPFKVVVPGGETPPTNIAGQFVLYDGLLIALDTNFSGNVAITFVPGTSAPDYTVESGVLTIYPTLSPSDTITVYSFSNAASMGWETVTYPVVGFTYLVPIPYASDYAMVTLDGAEIAPQLDYEIVDNPLGWDSLPLDAVPLDLAYATSELNIFNPGSAGNVTASICTAQPAREEMQWMTNTVTPAFARMPVDLNNSGQQTTGVPTHGSIMTPQPLFDSRFAYLRLSPYLAGSLADPLAPGDTQIVANLLLRPISPKLEPAFPLPNVYTANDPGVVWINNERIEYFGFSQSGQTVTLSGLRRGTQGTSIQEQRTVSYIIGNGASTSYVVNAIGPVEVFIDDFPIGADAFTVVVSGSTTIVTLNAAFGAAVTLAITSGFTYPIGEQLYNGKEPFTIPVPLGIPCGNRELMPMHQIIAG